MLTIERNSLSYDSKTIQSFAYFFDYGKFQINFHKQFEKKIV